MYHAGRRFSCAVALIGLVAGFSSCRRKEKALLTRARPPFKSVAFAKDEGRVKPVDKVADRPIRIAVLGLENNPFWIPVKDGALKAAEELAPRNCRVDWIVPAGESHGASVFGSAIENAVVQGYDAIATIAGDSGTVPFINRAVESGVPVATFNSETETENKRLFFVGADLYRQGRVAAEKMAELLGRPSPGLRSPPSEASAKEGGGEGKVAVITGFFSVEAHELRRKGFLDRLKEVAPDVEIVGEVENQDKAKMAYDQARDFITSNPDLNGIYVTAGGPFGAAKAVEDGGKAGIVRIVCYDFVDETMEFVSRGVISGTIGQNPFAQGHDPAVRLFNYLVGGVVPEAGKLLTRADFVTVANVDRYWSPGPRGRHGDGTTKPGN